MPKFGECIKEEEWGEFEGEWIAARMYGTVNVGVLGLDGNFYLDISHSIGKPRTIFLDPKQHQILPLTKLIKS